MNDKVVNISIKRFDGGYYVKVCCGISYLHSWCFTLWGAKRDAKKFVAVFKARNSDFCVMKWEEKT